ncbi:DUF1707 SHOCT-like domain-containing protein [Nigerium massiliense]|uniref:DUF1707 SHOCT-like domain-containing protein n=1 Tax=Nigerium massiliense TaxID=1522317 RepID=UPI00058ED920|nr:DUF1707 domain-containing protein [Nigerium massiliense]
MSTPDGPHIRIGHAERDQAVSVLQEAAAQGRLTMDELDGRVEEALSAKTRGDLHAVLADLVPRGPLDEMLVPQTRRPSLGPGYSWEDPLVLTARWENEKRLGRWDVPPFLEVNAVAADVKLNFCHATPVSLVIDIVVQGGAGDCVLVVPGGWGVDLDRYVKGMGSVKNEVTTRAQQGNPQIMVRGHGSLGSLKARYPTGWDERQQRRYLERSQPPGATPPRP